MPTNKEENKIIDEKLIDVLRDERNMIGSTIRTETNMRWVTSAALMYAILIIYNYCLNKQAGTKSGQGGFGNFRHIILRFFSIIIHHRAALGYYWQLSSL